ncbi:MAG: hypothetical protein E6J62_08195 [Deltaproteobacteria bacterium]|nr:MAG: hypothetical protein E6J85_06735 [Deltaproteobacteria bacterium]TMB36016.1 MAG: hypothetical protein E6J62_08195 [Deltaproteobacteria bacterium]TMB36447.1 MAG: hypothetical protein E6J61_00485 [Deltaproteobacteria bacterium]
MQRKTTKKSGAPDAPKASGTLDTGRPPHRNPTEREELIHNPNYNQAGNEAGSGDQAQGSQTGNDIDTVP